ncbi:hypothetical protein ACH9L7_14075 [Haloferax sp. S1W]|uniref:hypothetical protein n=1 Tax=Haloferax sp. S1W TaxID=3377110 RepID=UPI0037CA5765
MTTTDLTGENRCWPCTVANAFVGLLVGWVPLAVALASGETTIVTGTLIWGVAVTVVTGYYLVSRGYLPESGRVAKATGLHERIGPGSDETGDDVE